MIPRLCHADRHMPKLLPYSKARLARRFKQQVVNKYLQLQVLQLQVLQLQVLQVQIFTIVCLSEVSQRLFSPIKFGPIYVYHITNSYF